MKTKTVSIVVNGREKEVDKGELDFADVVELAYGHPPEGGNICYTITYTRGNANKPAGTLVEGESVRVKEGMIFNVTRTDKS